ncbi:conserved hypothetical protein [Microsporum canis CBS 113480]|uniref:Uncharacterized protein n=1 Tax=Arthroderma otae (strain ATCC MYA-4605 / CBS 113480) TaxID=554155 RepID=C5FPM7_ARTOC|nr:conserved hypothetical protein [Microsporum canis CBS 113480]EEQ31632.1 conserved hypothetical protein [Microsporum canis CBS 113480]
MSDVRTEALQLALQLRTFRTLRYIDEVVKTPTYHNWRQNNQTSITGNSDDEPTRPLGRPRSQSTRQSRDTTQEPTTSFPEPPSAPIARHTRRIASVTPIPPPSFINYRTPPSDDDRESLSPVPSEPPSVGYRPSQPTMATSDTTASQPVTTDQIKLIQNTMTQIMEQTSLVTRYPTSSTDIDEELGYFYPHMKDNADRPVVQVNQHTYYRSVYVFVNRLKDMVITKGENLVRSNVQASLRGQALEWYTVELTNIEKRAMTAFTIEAGWVDALVKRFKPRAAEALAAMTKLTFTMGDIHKGHDVRTYAHTMFRHAQAANIKSTYNQLTQSWNGLSPDLRRDIPEPTPLTTRAEFLNFVEAKSGIWRDIAQYRSNISSTRRQMRITIAIRIRIRPNPLVTQTRLNINRASQEVSFWQEDDYQEPQDYEEGWPEDQDQNLTDPAYDYDSFEQSTYNATTACSVLYNDLIATCKIYKQGFTSANKLHGHIKEANYITTKDATTLLAEALLASLSKDVVPVITSTFAEANPVKVNGIGQNTTVGYVKFHLSILGTLPDGPAQGPAIAQMTVEAYIIPQLKA